MQTRFNETFTEWNFLLSLKTVTTAQSKFKLLMYSSSSLPRSKASCVTTLAAAAITSASACWRLNSARNASASKNLSRATAAAESASALARTCCATATSSYGSACSRSSTAASSSARAKEQNLVIWVIFDPRQEILYSFPIMQMYEILYW